MKRPLNMMGKLRQLAYERETQMLLGDIEQVKAYDKYMAVIARKRRWLKK